VGRKGQVTIFIIIGILIVIAVSFLILTKKESDSFEETGQVEVFEEIDQFTKLCLSKTIDEGIRYLALRGGYYDLQLDYIDFENMKVAYYWDGEKKIPSIEIIEGELNKYVYYNLENCIDDYNSFKDKVSILQYELKDVDANINQKNIEADLELYLELIKDDTIIKRTKYDAVVDNSFKEKYDIISNIIDEQEKYPNEIIFGNILINSMKYNYTFNIIHKGFSEVLFSFNFTIPNQDDFRYNYATYYQWDYMYWNQLIEENHPLIVDTDIFNIENNLIFDFKVTASGNNLKFYDNSEKFNIDENQGIIYFNTSILDYGISSYIIKIRDDLGREDISFITFNKSGDAI